MLLPLYEQNGLRMGELARRARLSKQTMAELDRLARRRLGSRGVAELKAALAELIDLG